MKPFQAVVLGIFVSMALLGVFVFATFTASRTDAIGSVTIWGSLPQDSFDDLFTKIRGKRDDFNAVSYKQVPAENLIPQLVAAIAAGKGPDLVLFPASSIVKDGDKLQPITYSDIPRRDFQDTFVEAGEAFLTDEGVLGLPFYIDPMVMYWNRTLFSNAAIARPPKYWDELVTMAPQLTKKNPNGSLTTSAVAMGEWGNVAHAKGILITLMKQLGISVVQLGPNGYRSALTASNDNGVLVADSVLRYYADFSNPVKPAYSWNRSQRQSRDAFLAGTLAMYMGPASELIGIREANPNLNFDVAPLPVARGGSEGVYADVLALAVPRGAPNPNGAATVAVELTSADNSTFFATQSRMPSTRRDVELNADADQYLSVFRSSALRSFVFLDPNPTQSDSVFSRMIDNISSGRLGVSESIRAADDELQQLLKVQ